MIVWLASYPRSGNTFFRMLLNAACGVKTYSVYGDPLFDELGASEVIGHDHLNRRLEEVASSREVYFVKTHDLPADRHPAIYLVRDGRDAVVSYAHYITNLSRGRRQRRQHGDVGSRDDGFSGLLRSVIEGREHFGSWSRHVLSWTARAGGAPFVIRFEDLVADPALWLRRALVTCGEPTVIAEKMDVPAFESLHERWPHFFRKGAVGTWRDEMPDDLHELFWRHHEHGMAIAGYRKAAG